MSDTDNKMITKLGERFGINDTNSGSNVFAYTVNEEGQINSHSPEQEKSSGTPSGFTNQQTPKNKNNFFSVDLHVARVRPVILLTELDNKPYQHQA